MPEASVDEHGDALSREDDVGLPTEFRKRPTMDPIPQPSRV